MRGKQSAEGKTYQKMEKKQITININAKAVDYFKEKSAKVGIPYQTLINLYLTDCAEKNREVEISFT